MSSRGLDISELACPWQVADPLGIRKLGFWHCLNSIVQIMEPMTNGAPMWSALVTHTSRATYLSQGRLWLVLQCPQAPCLSGFTF